jgi:hypothetical protein
MDSHPEYCGPSPTHLFRILLANQDRYGSLSQDENWQALLEDTLNLFNTKLGIWLTNWSIEALDSAISVRSISQILKVIYEKEAQAHQKKRLFVKENHIYRILPYLQTEFIKLKLVYFIRDPRDMALSWKHSPSLRGCVIRAAKTWQLDQAEGLKIFDTLQTENQAILLRYEDLLMDPQNELKRLCHFLEIELVPQMLDFHKTDLAAKNAHRSADWRNLQNPLMRHNFNKYKTGLSTAEIQYIEACCGQEMYRLGYIESPKSAVDLTNLEKTISSFERYEKPAYQSLPLSEQQQRLERSKIEAGIHQRRPFSKVDPTA